MRLGPLSAYAAAAVVYASPFTPKVAAVDGARFERNGCSAPRVAVAPRAMSTGHGAPATMAALEEPRSLLEAMIVQMGGAARPSGKGVFIDLRV
jgi:hypothetical protein